MLPTSEYSTSMFPVKAHSGAPIAISYVYLVFIWHTTSRNMTTKNPHGLIASSRVFSSVIADATVGPLLRSNIIDSDTTITDLQSGQMMEVQFGDSPYLLVHRGYISVSL